MEMKDNGDTQEHAPNKKPERGTWVSKTEYILSCLGYAIGIGNVWRFPYLCYRNGGGAFLVPYLLMLFLCGLPLYFLETSIGQFSSLGCITMFKISPIFKGAGYATIVINVFCIAYYNLILTYPLMFIKNSFSNTLPWEDCDQPWNTEHCMKITGDEDISKNFTKNSSITTPSDEYFHNNILMISKSIEEIGSIVWHLFWGNLFAWAVIFACIANGVKSVGKVVYFTATFPFLVLLVLFIRGITLPGAIDGIYFYIYPQWHQLLNLRVWADAAIQIFYSLGPGWGGIINMASYNKFRNDNLSDSIIVPIVNCGTSIFAGFTVFSVIGFMSHRTGLAVADVAAGGPSLAFVTYPAAITMLPWSNLWAILFFSMLFFLGIDTCFVQLEAVISAILDECPALLKWKKTVAFVACILCFVLSIICTTNAGMYVVQLLDWYCASIGVILICFIEVIVVGWTYGCNNFTRDIHFMNGRKVHWIWIACWKYITPIILAFIFITTIIWNVEVTYNGRSYPGWSISLGWCLCLSSIVCIPVYMLYFLIFCCEGNLLQRIKFSLRPSLEWGPADQSVASEWREIAQNTISLEITSDTNKIH